MNMRPSTGLSSKKASTTFYCSKSLNNNILLHNDERGIDMKYFDKNGKEIKAGMWVVFDGKKVGRVYQSETEVDADDFGVRFIEYDEDYPSLHALDLTQIKSFKTISPVACAFEEQRYRFGGGLCLKLYMFTDNIIDLWQTITVNLESVPEGFAYIDINNCGESIIQWLTANDFMEPTGEFLTSGFVSYPLYKLNLPKIREYTINEEPSTEESRRIL